jgi:hypothetical protein
VQNRQHPALFRAMEQRFRLHIVRCASLDQAIRGRSGISSRKAIFTRQAAGHIASGLLRLPDARMAGACRTARDLSLIANLRACDIYSDLFWRVM